MASRCLVIPFPMHRVRRRSHRASAAQAVIEALHDVDTLEQAELRLFCWCFATSALLTCALQVLTR
jgi:hypothetical protein